MRFSPLLPKGNFLFWVKLWVKPKTQVSHTYFKRPFGTSSGCPNFRTVLIYSWVINSILHSASATVELSAIQPDNSVASAI
jgi:hypothetical protein